jgi:hypothetical protein
MTRPHGVNTDCPSTIKTLGCRYGNWHKVYRLFPVLRVAHEEAAATSRWMVVLFVGVESTFACFEATICQTLRQAACALFSAAEPVAADAYLIKDYVALQKSLGLGWAARPIGAVSQHAGQSSAARAPFGRSSWRPTGFAGPRAGPLRCRISRFGHRERFGGTGTGLDSGPSPFRR